MTRILISIAVLYNEFSELVRAAPFGMTGGKWKIARAAAEMLPSGDELPALSFPGHNSIGSGFAHRLQGYELLSIFADRDKRRRKAGIWSRSILCATVSLLRSGPHKKALASGAFSRFHIRLNK